MSLLHLEDFDGGTGTTEPLNGISVNAWAQATTGARTGIGRANFTSPNYYQVTISNVSDRHATLISGAAWFTASALPQLNLFQLYGDVATTQHITGNVTASGFIEVRRGNSSGTILGTSSGPTISTNPYFYVEVKVTLHDTTGAVIVKINNTEVLNLSNVDTKNGGTASVLDTIRWMGNSSTGGIDDFYLCNGAGSDSNDFLGDIKVHRVRPNGNGTYTDLTGSDGNQVDNFALVDETVPSSSDYTGSGTNGHKDTYAFENLVPTTGTVKGVQVRANAFKSDSGARSMRIVGRTNSSDFTGSDQSLGTSGVGYIANYGLNPITSSVWQIAEVNALELGMEVRP